MSFSKADAFFVTPVAAVFLAALALLMVTMSVAASSEGHEQIGTITYKNHYAERKLSSQVIWNALAQSSPVYNGDTIHTLVGSSAILHLRTQMEISMGEDTLLRLDETRQKMEVQLDGGIVSVRNPSRDRELSIAASARKIDMKDGELSVQDEGGALLVSVLAGQANLDSGKESQTISTGASLELQSDAIRAPIAQLLEPPAGSAIYRASVDAPTRLRWAFGPSAQGGQARAARLIIASDSAFKGLESSQVVNASELSLALGSGTHYWKIQTSTGGESAIGWFHILDQDYPLPIEPRDRSFSFSATPPLVSFSWSGVANAGAYRLSIEKKGTGSSIFSRVVAGTSIGLDTLGKGDYRWSVSAICGPDGKEFVGAAASFAIVPQAVPAPNIRDSSEAGEASSAGRTPRKISVEALKHGAIIAGWDDVTGADYYEARISRDAKGAATICQAKTASNSIASPTALAPGDYYVQVRSVAGKTSSDYSEAQPFTVTDPQAIAALFPPEGFVADPDSRNIRFGWNDPNGSGRVRLQLSVDPSFAHLIADRPSSADAADIDFPKGMSGKVYWRVAAASAGLGSNSNARSLYMPDLLASPRITAPAEGVALDIGSVGKLRLGWETSPGANRYIVSLYQLIGGRRTLIQSWESVEPYVNAFELRRLGIGRFAWTVSADEVSGGEILARSPAETAYFSVSHFHPLPPPVVHRPSSGA
jgi:hypothetical protein